MKLSPNEQKVLDYLKKPRTAKEVMDYLGHQLPPYGILRLLQRLDVVDKIGPYERALSTFVQSGRPMRLVPNYMTYREPMVVMGVKI
jgi:hypothetical protein